MEVATQRPGAGSVPEVLQRAARVPQCLAEWVQRRAQLLLPWVLPGNERTGMSIISQDSPQE